MKKNKKEVATFTFGSDGEMHIHDIKKNKIVSALDVVKNDKHDMIDLGDGYKCFADNVLLENNVPPAKTKEEFLNRFSTVFNKMQKHLGGNYRFVAKAAHVYDAEDLMDKRATEIGCSTTMDVYRRIVNQPDQDAFKNSPLRTGSFHIHIRNSAKNGKLHDIESKEKAIKILDAVLGASSVIFDKDPTCKTRRVWYGRCGESRFPDGGVEYRCLGNYALRSPQLVELVYDLTNHALEYVKNNKENDILGAVDENEVQKAINEMDIPLAEKILGQIKLPADLMARVKADYNVDDAQSIYNNWKIEVPKADIQAA